MRHIPIIFELQLQPRIQAGVVKNAILDKFLLERKTAENVAVRPKLDIRAVRLCAFALPAALQLALRKYGLGHLALAKRPHQKML